LNLPDDRDQNIWKNELIKFTSKDTMKAGLEGQIFRWVPVYKEDENIITNQVDWQAITIADLYQKRWDIEIFSGYKRKCCKVANICGYDSFPAFGANPEGILQK